MKRRMFCEAGTAKAEMFAINLRSGVPIYEQLKKAIIENALLGVLEPDEQLPSVRSLSKELGVNPNTVQKAYQSLESDGIIYSLAGKGSFISTQMSLLPAVRRDVEKKLTSALEEAYMAGLTREEIQRLAEAAEKSYLQKIKGGSAK